MPAFGFLLLLFLIIAPFYLGRSELYLLVEIFSYLALASLWNLLAGYTGLASVGQQAFVGLGGYSLFALTIFSRMPPILAVLAVNDWTAFVVFIVVIGGIGRMEGPLIGTIVFFLLRWFLADLGPWYLMLLGAFAIFITLTMPKGIAGLLAERFDLDFFLLRRRVGLPKQNSEDSTHSGLADAPEHSAK